MRFEISLFMNMALSTFGRCVVIITRSKIQYSGNRLYSRWSHRSPARVVLQSLPTSGSSLETEEIIDLDPQALRKSREEHAEKLKKGKAKKQPAAISQSVSEEHYDRTEVEVKLSDEKPHRPANIDPQKIKERREKALNTEKKNLSNEKVYDENGELIYEKLNLNNGTVGSILTNLKSKKSRERVGKILVEGWRLIVDGLKAKCPLKYVIFSRKPDLDHIKAYLPSEGVKLYKIPYKEIQLWSSVDTSPGILGVFEIPKPSNIFRLEKPLPLQIICDNVRDPGNLGAILRASVGVGCNKVLLMKGCVDMWDPKVIRSAAGAHFRVPIHNSLEWHQVFNIVEPDSSVFIGDNNFKVEMSHKAEDSVDLEGIENLNVPVVPYYSVEYSRLKSVTLIIGGETEGISEDSYRFAASRKGLRVNIPLQNGVDSLNTGMATAVIAFEIKKQILEAKALALHTVAQ